MESAAGDALPADHGHSQVDHERSKAPDESFCYIASGQGSKLADAATRDAPLAPELITSALEKALVIAQQSKGNVQLIDWKRGHMEIAAHSGFSLQFLDRFRTVKKSDDCACGRAFRLRETVVIDDVVDDLQFLPFREAALEAGFRSVQSTPMISRSGAFLGMISTHGSHSPSSERLEAMRVLARETANDLIRLISRARATGIIVDNPSWLTAADQVAIAQRAISRTTELLKQPTPDTFLGRGLIKTQP